MKLSIAFSAWLVYFSTRWADSSHTRSYLEEGPKQELGHWFELILDPPAILNQLLCCESSQQNWLSSFLLGQCGDNSKLDDIISSYKGAFAGVLRCTQSHWRCAFRCQVNRVHIFRSKAILFTLAFQCSLV